MQRCLFALTALGLLLVGAQGQAGSERQEPWQAFLPDSAFKELSQRSIQAIESAAKTNDKSAAGKIAVEASILAGYTMSVKDPSAAEAAKLRGAAQAAPQQDLKQLTSFGKTIQDAPPKAIVWKGMLSDTTDLMEIFRSKAKKGEGIAADLQYHPKLKNQNGIEALIGALAGKKLSDENTAKVSKELPLLAYRIAVVGNVTYEAAPVKDTKKWQGFALQMRDASIALADAATQKNGAAIHKAAQALENSCTNCHRDFKNK